MGSRIFGILLLIATVGLVLAMLLLPDPAKSATLGKSKSCELGEFCISQYAKNVGAVSGDSISFTVKLRNNLNFASPKLVLRYSVARQVLTRAATPAYKIVPDGIVVWRVPRLEPGDTWTAKVRVEVLSYAKKTVANTAEVFYGKEKWLRSRLAYMINDPEVVIIIQQGATA